MCGECGCGQGEARHASVRLRAHVHTGRVVQIGRDVLEGNDALAAANRGRLAASRVLCVNVMSSPGAGKTALLVEALSRLLPRCPAAVVVGDQQTSLDAERLRATGAPSVQINTGEGCHLDASQVGEALAALPIPEGGVLFVENVGNLVCPAAFDLGEALRVVLLSVTEGEDKPLKYAGMFERADVVLITKVDLLPHLRLDLALLERHLSVVCPAARVLRVSTVSGEGVDAFVSLLDERRAASA